jgi:inorganic pyrophosphatase
VVRKSLIDLPLGKNPPKVINAVVEIPKGSRNKYEYDKELNIFRLDRLLYSSVHYPTDYGFIPSTLSKDGDPLDILVLVSEPTSTGVIIDVRPIGVLYMVDEKGEDEKIISVPYGDPFYDFIKDISSLPKHHVREIDHFFSIYKDLEGKQAETSGYRGAEEAEKVVMNGHELFTSKRLNPSTSRGPL